MKISNFFGIILLVILLQGKLLYSQDLTNLTLIAHYPLASTANDTTGNNGPMILINTPFQDDGIYCNGNYIYGDPDSCDAKTPVISDLDFETFAVSAMFKVLDAISLRRPVFIGGISWKWVSVFVDPDSTIGSGYNSVYFSATSSGEKYTPGTWHEVTFAYDSTEGIGRLYLDGVRVDSSTIQLNHGNDKTVGITNESVGMTFKGILKDLKIYSKRSGTGIEQLSDNIPSHFVVCQNYPNPFNAQTQINYQINHHADVSIRIYNLRGEEILTLMDKDKEAGSYKYVWNGRNKNGLSVASGIYIYKVEARSLRGYFSQERKMLLIQ